MQAVTWYENVEIGTMLAALIASAISILFIWKQNRDTTAVVDAAEISPEHLVASKLNVQRALVQSRTLTEQALARFASALRPNVFVAFENPKTEGGRKIFLVVHNLGLTTTLDVRISFEPELINCRETYNLKHLHSLIDHLPSLVPGAQIGHVLDHVLSIRESEIILPNEYTATITYSDADGKKFAIQQTLSTRMFTLRNSTWRFIERIDQSYIQAEESASDEFD